MRVSPRPRALFSRAPQAAAARIQELEVFKRERDELLAKAQSAADSSDGASSMIVKALRARISDLEAEVKVQAERIQALTEDNEQLAADNELLQNDTVSLSNAVKLSEQEAKEVGEALAQMQVKEAELAAMAVRLCPAAHNLPGRLPHPRAVTRQLAQVA